MTEETTASTANRSWKNILIPVIVVVLIGAIAVWKFCCQEEESPPVDYHALISNYCTEYSKVDFKAATVFAPTVRTYIALENVTPVQIDHEIAVERQTQTYPKIILLSDSIETKDMGNGETSATAWINEVYYLKTMMQYRSADLRCNFIFDANNKIVALAVLEQQNEKFSSQNPSK